MSFFGIQGYQPDWLTGREIVARAHGHRLHALIGRRLTDSWLVWDRTSDEWFADCPVLLDFEDEQLEITHQTFDELSITWNTINPREPITYGEDQEDASLTWRDDACLRLSASHGQQLRTVELLVWRGAETDLANDTVAVSFGSARDRITIANALDENAIEFGPPDPGYRSYPPHN
ncbi:hypothetical protein [Mycobacterium sp. NPDC050441]|uniref:hypothetical protein n=1 Tax=Mycobacterium sp. NPDC050441 TaxID=3155403 RepID=UPI0033D3089F